ncbi:MAG: 2-hydroxyacid dehydrogenase [Hyphomicrobium sp.]
MAPDDKPALAVALTGWNLDRWLPCLRNALPGRDLAVVETSETPLPERYYLFCWKPPADVLRGRPAPLLILCGGAGVDEILKNNPPQEVPVTRIVNPDLTGRMVEYVVLHALYHLRRMDEIAVNQRQGLWQSQHLAPARDVTVGLMGVGEMGRASGTALQALGFNVIGWGRSRRHGLPFRSYAGLVELDDFLSQTDILVCLLPSTPETRGLIDRSKLRKLRRGGLFAGPAFISAGRGDVAVEAELIEALQDGTLRAATLDVFAQEPLPAGSPFWGMSNVVITPHNAADSDPEAIAAAVAAEIERFEAGAPLLHPVDRVRGY